jgi:hypothetical protein
MSSKSPNSTKAYFPQFDISTYIYEEERRIKFLDLVAGTG